MPRTRNLLLFAIILIVAGVGTAYYVEKTRMALKAPAPPRPLPPQVQAASPDWVWYQGEGDAPKVSIRAGEMEALEGKVRLTRVELKLFHKDGKLFDRIQSASAEFNKEQGSLFSDGDVEITLAVPVEGSKPGRLVSIHSSGVHFDAKTGKAVTDRPTKCTFDLGDAEAVGAQYDPATRELELQSDVKLLWRGKDPKSKPMEVEAGHLLYREAESKVYLTPWSRMTKENLKLDAADSTATLDDNGNIRLVESAKAQGTNAHKDRKLNFAANELRMELTGKSEIEKIIGTGNAKLDSTSKTGQTAMISDRVDLQFAVVDKESVLTQANANGNSVVESRTPDRGSRVLKSNTIEMKMRPGGEEVDTLVTHSPADLELIPGKAAGSHRKLNAERLALTYGAKNQLKTARAVKVTTETQKPAERGKKPPPPATTSSQDLLAEFNEESGEMTRLEQWTNFRYQQGDRRASANRAIMQAAGNQATLDGAARAWDATGSVEAATIVMDQDTGDFTAKTGVRSTRAPEAKQAKGGMLSKGDALQATADSMESREQNSRLVYSGKAVLWQGGNRLTGDRVTIDRSSQSLRAEGNVVSQFLDQPTSASAAKKKDRGYTTIRASSLDYSDKDKLALYRGPVRLTRDAMDVSSKELRAWFSPEGREGDSRLDRAVADGNVVILHDQQGRLRKGLSEHAEYFVGDEKVELTGGSPQLIDSVSGTTTGAKLTYWMNNDRFQVDGGPARAVSQIQRKK